VPDSAQLSDLDLIQIRFHLRDMLVDDHGYSEQSDASAWTQLYLDWGLDPGSALVALVRSGDGLRIVVCHGNEDQRLHVHAFVANGLFQSPSSAEPALARFVSTISQRYRAWVDLRAERSRYIERTGVLQGGVVGAIGTIAAKVVTDTTPLVGGLKLDAVGLTGLFVVLLLLPPGFRLLRLTWRTRHWQWWP
jgi:hypothetical protein